MPGPRAVGRYVLFDELGSGGMGTVHLARINGEHGFSRSVVVKRLHPGYASDPDVVAMFVDEARLASRIQHPNVVATLDVVAYHDELLLVMEYVAGLTLAQLLRRTAGAPLPPAIAARIVGDVLRGLHAAHEATDADQRPLAIVHRDVSPQNILVGADGVSRVLDFGIAKAAVRAQRTRQGEIKGKLGYMAPEQLVKATFVDRRSDVYAAGVVLWETLTGRRMRDAAAEDALRNLRSDVPVVAPSIVRADGMVSAALDAVVARALAHDPEQRFATAVAMASALEAAVERVSAATVESELARLAGDILDARAAQVAATERIPLDGHDDLTTAGPGPAPGAKAIADRDARAELPTHRDQAPTPAAEPSRRPPPHRVLRRLAWASVALLGLLLIIPRARRERQDRPEASSTPSPPSGSSSSPPVLVAPPPPAPNLDPLLPPAATASVREEPRRRPSRPRRPRSSTCDVPYTVGADGIRHIREDCLTAP